MNFSKKWNFKWKIPLKSENFPKILNGILNGKKNKISSLKIKKWKSVHEHNCGFRLLVYIFYHHSS